MSGAARAWDLNEELLAAARKGDLAAVKALLERGAEVNAKTRYGATPLSYAADRGHTEIVQLLIERGADVNAKDTFYGATPIVWASSRNHAKIVRMLLEKGAQSKELALSIAVSEGHLDVARAVLELGGMTPEALGKHLAAATRNKHEEVAALLRQSGARLPVINEFKLEPEALKAYAGVYKGANGEFTFVVKEGRLEGGPTGGQVYALMATDKQAFVIKDYPDLSLAFRFEGEKVVAVTIKQGGGEQVYQRVEVK
jgi:ankyrin repeat protein